MADIISTILQRATALNSRYSGLLVASATATVGLCTYLLLAKREASPEQDDVPSLYEEDTVRILQLFLENLTTVAARHTRAAEGLKQQIEAQGQAVDTKQFMIGYVLPQFETAIQDLQTQIFQKFDIEEHELQEATEYYIKRGNLKLVEITSKINYVYKDFGGEVEEEEWETEGVVSGPGGVDREKELSLANYLEVLDALVELIVSKNDVYFTEFKALYGAPKTPELIQKLQDGLVKLSEEAEIEAYDVCGITATQFHSAMMKYRESPEAQNAIVMLQQTNHQMLKSYGLME